jgi:CMP-N,N'-diacetyllegionaminic acid synthase
VNIVAIIPARAGSKEIKNKNLKKFNGKSLVKKSIEEAIKSKQFSKIIITSDSKKILSESNNFDKKKIHKILRPKSLSKDNSSIYGVMIHAIKEYEKLANNKIDIVVLLQPVTPFRTYKHINKVVNYHKKVKSDAVITITKFDYPVYWGLKKDNNNQIFNFIKNGNKFIRRQDAPQVFKPAGLVYSIRKDFLLKIFKIRKILPLGDTRGVEVSIKDAINLDSKLQYKIAKAIY